MDCPPVPATGVRHRVAPAPLAGVGVVARLIGFVVVVALAVGGALVLVSERAALTRSGYRIAELERERRRLVERNRRLEAQVAGLKTPAHILQRAKDFDLAVQPPEERLKQELKEHEHQQPAGAPRRPGARSRERGGRR